jgi:hypothetical protein
MFIGHFAVAFAAKKAAPRASLGTLLAASQALDLLWPTFVLLGWERASIAPGDTVVTPLRFESYPYSHSLAATVVWAVAFGLAYLALRRYWAGAITVGLAVASHWLLDLASHRPDLPLGFGGGPKLGLGLWQSLPATLIVEGTLFVAGVAIYVTATRPLDRVGRFALVGLVGFLSVAYLANLFGPPPPSIAAVAWSGEGIWLLVAWGWWLDHHRASASR